MGCGSSKRLSGLQMSRLRTMLRDAYLHDEMTSGMTYAETLSAEEKKWFSAMVSANHALCKQIAADLEQEVEGGARNAIQDFIQHGGTLNQSEEHLADLIVHAAMKAAEVTLREAAKEEEARLKSEERIKTAGKAFQEASQAVATVERLLATARETGDVQVITEAETLAEVANLKRNETERILRTHAEQHRAYITWKAQDGESLERLLLADDTLAGESPVRLLNAHFLIALARAGGLLRRRQDLPVEAFLDLSALQRMPKAAGIRSLRLLCVSYPWLQPDHPDPKGTVLRLLASVLELFVAHEDDETGRVAGTYAVFLDFCSLHQKDNSGKRSKHEAALFSLALTSLDQLYSHPHTWILKATTLPDGYPEGFVFPSFNPDGTECTPNRAAYYERGWCFCESSMGNLVKSPVQVLDLGHFTGGRRGRYDVFSLFKECGSLAARPPPMHPSDFATILEEKSFTSKKADCETVAALYRRAFEMRVGKAKVLPFGELKWGDAEMEMLSRVLNEAASCELLILSGNSIGDGGLATLAGALREGAAMKLTQLIIDGNRFGNEGVAALAACLRDGAAPNLKRVSMCDNPRVSSSQSKWLSDAREGLEVLMKDDPVVSS